MIHSHRTKANAKENEKAKKIKENISNIKQIFPFRSRFLPVWMGLNGIYRDRGTGEPFQKL